MTHRALARGLLQAPAGEDEALTFTASTTRLNRYGFRLRHDGWRIDNYNANPVVLWMHVPFMRPIGRGRASLENGRLLNRVTFDRDNPFAADIERQYRGGFLNAVSVGIDFVDEKGAPLTGRPTSEQIEKEAYYDLAEVSAVPVPADPGALKMNRATLAAAYGTLGLELLDEFAELAGWQPNGDQLSQWGAVIGETPPPQQVADWLARNDPTLAPSVPGLGGGTTDDRLTAMEAAFGRLMSLLEQSLSRALAVPKIRDALAQAGDLEASAGDPDDAEEPEDSEGDPDGAQPKTEGWAPDAVQGFLAGIRLSAGKEQGT